MPLLADWAQGDVDPCEALEHVCCVFFFPCRWVRLAQQVATAFEFDLAVAIGEQSIVAQAHEATRKDVQEKATQELIGLQGHGLLLSMVGVVLVAEAYLIVLH